MKLLKIGSAVLSVLLGIGVVRAFLEKYYVGFYYVNKEEERQMMEEELESMDLRGNPTHQCICGSEKFIVVATFENYEISSYLLDMQCIECDSIATAPTPMDRENME